MASILRLPVLVFFGIFLFSTNLCAAEPLKIHVSILPQQYFVERIAGELAEVDVLVTPGKNPAIYSPTPAQIKKLASADIYFRIGVSFENGFMHKITSIAPDIMVIDTRKGISLRDMEAHMHETDHKKSPGKDLEGAGHGDSGHYTAGRDPHIWMNPILVKKQAATILDALIRLDPDNAHRFRDNFDAFARDLDQLNTRLKKLLAPLTGENLFVFHPAFGYFADAFGMHQVPVETMGRSPKGKELSAIIKLARQEKARIIFVQPQFDRHAAENIARAINGTVVSINPLAYDYLTNMEQLADTIATALTP